MRAAPIFKTTVAALPEKRFYLKIFNMAFLRFLLVINVNIPA
jgi:hypothetical protein